MDAMTTAYLSREEKAEEICSCAKSLLNPTPISRMSHYLYVLANIVYNRAGPIFITVLILCIHHLENDHVETSVKVDMMKVDSTEIECNPQNVSSQLHAIFIS